MYFSAELLKLRERGLLFSAPPLFKLLSHGSGDLHGCVDPVPNVTRNFHGIRHSSTSLRFFYLYSLIFFTFAQSLYRKEAPTKSAPPSGAAPFSPTFSIFLHFFSANHEFTLNPVQLNPLFCAGRIKGLCCFSLAHIRNLCAYALCLCGKDRIRRDIEL